MVMIFKGNGQVTRLRIKGNGYAATRKRFHANDSSACVRSRWKVTPEVLMMAAGDFPEKRLRYAQRVPVDCIRPASCSAFQCQEISKQRFITSENQNILTRFYNINSFLFGITIKT